MDKTSCIVSSSLSTRKKRVLSLLGWSYATIKYLRRKGFVTTCMLARIRCITKKEKVATSSKESRYFKDMIINESSGITAGEIYLLHTI
jgi:hypothetical protein